MWKLNPESKHILIDAWGIDFNFLNDPNYIESALREMAKATNSKIIKSVYHKYEPQGVSFILLVSESHCSIHTYPEEGYLAADIFTCGRTNPERAVPVLKEKFKPKILNVTVIYRGRRW